MDNVANELCGKERVGYFLDIVGVGAVLETIKDIEIREFSKVPEQVGSLILNKVDRLPDNSGYILAYITYSEISDTVAVSYLVDDLGNSAKGIARARIFGLPDIVTIEGIRKSYNVRNLNSKAYLFKISSSGVN